jgi:hypothetical protein
MKRSLCQVRKQLLRWKDRSARSENNSWDEKIALPGQKTTLEIKRSLCQVRKQLLRSKDRSARSENNSWDEKIALPGQKTTLEIKRSLCQVRKQLLRSKDRSARSENNSWDEKIALPGQKTTLEMKRSLCQVRKHSGKGQAGRPAYPFMPTTFFFHIFFVLFHLFIFILFYADGIYFHICFCFYSILFVFILFYVRFRCIWRYVAFRAGRMDIFFALLRLFYSAYTGKSQYTSRRARSQILNSALGFLPHTASHALQIVWWKSTLFLSAIFWSLLIMNDLVSIKTQKTSKVIFSLLYFSEFERKRKNEKKKKQNYTPAPPNFPSPGPQPYTDSSKALLNLVERV